MDHDTFAHCLQAGTGVSGIARALAAALPADPLAASLPALAAALLAPDQPLPPELTGEAPAVPLRDRPFLEALETLRAQIDWSHLTVRSEPARSRLVSKQTHEPVAGLRPVQDWGPLALLTHAALSLVRPSRRAAVVVTMRDDGISLLEWVAHYRAVGFEGIFIYSNDNADGSDALLNCLAEQGIITYIENVTTGTISPQRKAFVHSLHFLPELRDFQWVFYADSDEFLMLDQAYDYRVQPLLQAVDQKFGADLPGALYYGWRWYVSDYVFARENGLLLERFTHATPHKLGKSLVQLAQVLSMRSLHFPDLLDGYCVDAGLEVIPGTRSADRASAMWAYPGSDYRGGQINHYWCKSFEEFLIKKRRGDLLSPDRRNDYSRELQTFFLWNARSTPSNAAPPPSVLLTRVHAELASLLRLPGVAKLQHRIAEGFRRLLGSIGTPDALRRHYEQEYSQMSLPPADVRKFDHQGPWYTIPLKTLHEERRPATYLEIGSATGDSLALASGRCVAIDIDFHITTNVVGAKAELHLFQMKSDVFFASHDVRKVLDGPVKLAFLDGMHWYEYLLRDFMNTERHCSRDALIVLHDCLPTDLHVARRDPDDTSLVDQSDRRGWWAGDVWKLLPILREYRPDLTIRCFDAPPTGLVVVSDLDPHSSVLANAYDDILLRYAPLTLAEYGIDRLFAEAAIQPAADIAACVPAAMPLAPWAENVGSELEFWELTLRRRAENGEAAAPPTPRDQSWVRAAVRPTPKPDEKLQLLDVGCGPTPQGTPTVECGVEVTLADALGDAYNALLDKYGFVYYPRIRPVKGEELTKIFGKAAFHAVCCNNALDHFEDPRRAFAEMVEVCKPGGVILIASIENEGEQTRYSGLHQWNLQADDAGLWLWNNNIKENLFLPFKEYLEYSWQYADYSKDVKVFCATFKKSLT